MLHHPNLETKDLKRSVEEMVQMLLSTKENSHDKIDINVLSMVCRGANSIKEIRSVARVLDDLIFQSNDLDSIIEIMLNTIKPTLSSVRIKPLLMFHLYGWQMGGDGRVISSVTNHLIQNYNVIITVFGPKGKSSYSIDPKTSFFPIYGQDNKFGRLLLLIKLLRPDIFIGNNNNLPELLDLYPTLSREGIKTIAYNHEYYFFPHNHQVLYKGVIDRNRAFEKASAVCFLTALSANAYSLINNNAAIMPNPNTFQVQSEDYFNPFGKTILAVGRFDDPIKRLDRLLEVFKLVLYRHPDAKLMVVGPYNLAARIPVNSDEKISDFLKRLQIEESKLIFIGEQKDVAHFYKNSDVFVMTSENEGFGMVLTEAGTLGLPSVIFSIPGLDEIILEGQNGFIVPQDDISAMSERLSDIFDDMNLRRKMSSRAIELSDRFTIDRIGARWEKLIDVILSHDSHEDINQILSSEFMHEVSDSVSFAKQVATEYEKTSIKITNYQSKLSGNHFIISSSNDTVAKKLKFNLRNYGFKETLRKILGNLKKLLLKYYYRLRSRLRL